MLLEGTIPISMMISEDRSVLIHGISDVYVAIPLCKVHLDGKYLVGPFAVGLVTALPIDGIYSLVGNDNACHKVLPILQKVPVVDVKAENLEDTFPGIFPNCVVTSSQCKAIETQHSANSNVNNGVHSDENDMMMLVYIDISNTFLVDVYM